MNNIPDRRWYEQVSQERGVTLRCPFATVESCPRYYQSLSLLGQVGSSQIPVSEDKRLLKHWEASDLWPRTAELASSVLGPSDTPSMFLNFCPEVAFERFGYFAMSLIRHGDEIDSGSAHEQLRREGAPANHPSWSWAACVGQHFTECPIYAVLSHRCQTPATIAQEESEPWWRKHLFEMVGAVLATIAGVILTKWLS